MTWYPQEYISNLPMTSMGLRASPSSNYPGRTYRFYSGPVVYPFSHGLTYTRFLHSLAPTTPTALSVPLHGHHRNATVSGSQGAVRVTHARCASLSLPLHVDVRNVGPRDGSHALLVFATPPPARGHWAPRRHLVAFEKVHVASGSGRRVRVNVHVCKHLSVVDRAGVRRIPLGLHSFSIGDLRHSVSLHADALGVIKS